MRSTLIAFALLGAATASAETRVKGVIDNNPTWTADGNPYILEGDIVVPEGMTLTLQPDVEVVASANDETSSGLDPLRVEIRVAGTLNVNGTREMPVVMKGPATEGLWYGVVFEGSSTASTLAGARIEGAFRAITSSTHFALRDSVLTSSYDTCLLQLSGTATVLGTEFRQCGHDAIFVDADGDLSMRRSLVTSSGHERFAVRVYGKATIEKSTIAQNPHGGVELRTSQAVSMKGNIVAFNGDFGVSNSNNAVLTFQNNNTFGHSTNLDGVNAVNSQNLSVDPQFQSATDFRLTAASPCRNVGLNGSDMGAFPFSGNVHSLIANAPEIVIRVKESIVLNINAFDEDNQTVDTTFVWSVNPTIGTLDVSNNTRQATLNIKCLPGIFSEGLTVSAGGKSLIVPVTINKGLIDAVSISPAETTLDAGASAVFTAQAVDNCANLVTTDVEWDAEVGSIDSTGKFTAPTTPGTFEQALRASIDGVTKTARVFVTSGRVKTVTLTPAVIEVNPGAQMTLSALAEDDFGNPVNMSVSWNVASAAGTISNAGVFTARTTAGNFPEAVTAIVDGVMAKATVTIKPGAATKLNLMPASVTLAPLGTTTFVAQARDAFDNLTSDTVVWKVENSEAGTIAQDGKFTAGTKVGQYANAVRATVGSFSMTANVAVTPGGLSEINITPRQFSIAVGETQALSATGKDAQGNPVAITPVWKVIRGGGTISSVGVFKAQDKVGTYENTVMVEVGGVTALATVEVTAGPVVKLEIVPGEVEMGSGTHLAFTVDAFDFLGNKVTQPLVAWNADVAAGEITEKGVFTAGKSPGTFEGAITASVNGLETSATVRIVEVKIPKKKTPTSSPEPTGCSQTGGGMFAPWALLLLLGGRRLMRPKARR